MKDKAVLFLFFLRELKFFLENLFFLSGGIQVNNLVVDFLFIFKKTYMYIKLHVLI